MLVSYKWLSEMLDLTKATPQELGDKMSLTGIEVESVTHLADGLKKLVVGFVKECIPHADSDHLSICQVDVGKSEPYQIVCGAPNIKAGIKVIVALPGARIAGNTKIKKGKMRGVASLGMICSLQELGFAEAVVPKEFTDGIYYLPEEAVIGDEVYSYLDMDDSAIELAITPNRADALSMRGVAFEVGAILHQAPKFKEVVLKEEANDSVSDYISVKVEDEINTPIYKMRIIKNVKIAPSPLWLQKRLMIEGIRPINNVVDVTNYILLLFGQPLHAFDYNKFKDKVIVVRRARNDEKLITLDEVERKLSAENLVITNNNKPVALAGVMGGENTQIDTNTTTVALEAALFDPQLIRRTSKKFNLHSESSMRFEKGINKETVGKACDVAAAMIAELASGKVVSGVAVGSDFVQEKKIIGIKLEHINNSLGTALTVDEVNEIFKALGFTYTVLEHDYSVNIPLRRWDIKIVADLLEEVARIYGYDRLPSTLPNGAVANGLTAKQRLVRKMKEMLEGAGVSEVISYALTTKEKARQFRMNESNLTHLAWPMSEERSVLRLNLVSGLLDNIHFNTARKLKSLAIYEFGRVFINTNNPLKDLPKEEVHLGFALTGLWQEKDWQTSKDEINFFHLKGILEELFRAVGVERLITYEVWNDSEELHPGQAAKILLNGEIVGFLGQVHPMMAKKYDIFKTYVAELSVDALLLVNKSSLVFTAVSKFPEVTRDIAILVKENVSNQDLVQLIQSASGRFLRKVELFDVYAAGDNIEKGQKSMAYTLTFSNSETTLTDEEVNAAMKKVEKALVEKAHAQIR
ncbi:MAG: phenylalanine--tRNA ligase subunit beta [Streptococcaceae bacterium]|jgi:phenylalanyl-tRNA synthetase beta chain|nr:phenylalanine--tRNA ligase subunit beta [Streptococcaceae bacterium]